ncbi:hypothetical protein D1641_18660, partial [Colidextribacter sp. OB.20]|uniref:hypothetical protein n=1 Tax=Colidextribacter sp. OB.20 TaxID=2304568 RepID=UPI00136F4C2F
LASIAQATKINMFGNLNLPTNAELARDNVAEMVFNAITKTVPVQYNELLGVYYNENQGIIYSLEFNYLQTLGYKNFDLVYKSDTRDMYGRPATTWGVGRYNAGNSTTSSGTITKTDQLTTDGGLKPSLVRLQEKDEIITVPNAATYVYTDKTKEKDVYSDLGKTVCTDTAKDKDRGYTWVAYVNGKEVEEKVAGKDGKDLIPKSGTAGDKRYIYTAKGTQTEIYIDDDEQTVDVIEINYYIGQVSSVKEDKGGRYVTVKELSTGSSLNERTFYTGSYAEDDYVIYTMDYVEDDKDYVIAEMFEPEVVTGEINRVEKDKDDSDTYLRFEQDGTKYPYSFQYQGSTKNGESHQSHMVYDLDELNNSVHPALKTDYDLLLDPNGYVVAFREANQKPNQYLYVKDSDEELRDWIAKVLLTDNTSAKVEVKDELDGLDDGITEEYYHPQLNDPAPATNKVTFKKAGIDWVDYELVGGSTGTKASNIDQLIWKYSVSDSGVYTLKFIEPQKTWNNTEDKDTQWYMTDAKIETGKAYVTGTRPNADGTTKENNEFIVDAKTIFVDDANGKVYTGYKEVPNVDNANVAYVLNKGVAKVVFVLDGDIYDSSSVYFMLKDTDRETFKYDGDNYWDFDNAYVNGERQSHFYVRTNALNGGDSDRLNLKAGHLYKVEKTIEDGEYITKVVEWKDGDNDALPQALLTINAVGDETFWLNQYKEETVYKYDTVDGDDPTQIVLVEYDADGKLDNITTGR